MSGDEGNDSDMIYCGIDEENRNDQMDAISSI
jgi:hypothetical protein